MKFNFPTPVAQSVHVAWNRSNMPVQVTMERNEPTGLTDPRGKPITRRAELGSVWIPYRDALQMKQNLESIEQRIVKP